MEDEEDDEEPIEHVKPNAGVIFSWCFEATAVFAKVANEEANRKWPSWMQESNQGRMTMSSLQKDIFNFVAKGGESSFGTTMITPASIIDFANVNRRLTAIEFDPFMQDVAAKVNAAGLGPRPFHLAEIGAVFSEYDIKAEQSLVRAEGIPIVPMEAGMFNLFG